MHRNLIGLFELQEQRLQGAPNKLNPEIGRFDVNFGQDSMADTTLLADRGHMTASTCALVTRFLGDGPNHGNAGALAWP